MSQILDALKGYITPELVSKAASYLGESDFTVSRGITSLIPSLLGGMASQTENSDMMSNLFELIKGSDAGVLDNLSGLFTGQGNGDLANNLVSILFGGNANSILSKIGSFAGLKGDSANSLLAMVSPMVMGYLSKMIGSNGMDISGFTSLLNSEKSSFMDALPAGLSSSLGLGNIASGLESGVEEIREEAEKAKAGVGRWLIPLLLLGGLAYAAYHFLGSPEVKDSVANVTETVTEAAEDVKDATVEVVNDGVEAAGDMVEGLGNFFKRVLPGGKELNIPQNGIENKLVDFIEDADAAIDKETWFNFDRLTFSTGSATLDMEKSQEQLGNIAAILEAYPNTEIKIGGYTDNTGSEETNRQVSQARAEAVMTALADMGIDADRMEAEGYGPQHPVASNDTEEGRAKNRRIAVRFTAK
ncbi:MAG: OmpA family protein [Bacteroidota bacterium]